MQAKGHSFWVRLSGCQFVEFFNREKDSRTREFEEIEREEPEILNVEQEGDIARIICTTGVLSTQYDSIEVHLDTGEPVTLQALREACDRYWDEWEKSHRT